MPEPVSLHDALRGVMRWLYIPDPKFGGSRISCKSCPWNRPKSKLRAYRRHYRRKHLET